MVELRKRPPRNEPPAPPPAAKKGRAAPTTNKSKVTKPPAKKDSGVAAKAKAAASKVKEAIAGPVATDTSDKQPTVEDETAVETGEAGLIPETAGTAPNSTTIPAEPAAPTNEVAMSDAPATGDEGRPPATEDLENPPETGKIEPAGATATATTSVDAPGASTSPAPTADTATLPLSAASVGKQLPLSTLDGQVETHTGTSVSFSSLLSASQGLIIFTYPRASTPGCTTQACSFRDHHGDFTASGYKVYGLSTDSVKANNTFATKQGLQYELLCDPGATLTGALGMKKPGNAKGTLRGVVVVDGAGIVKVWFQGGPAKTVEVVEEYLGTLK